MENASSNAALMRRIVQVEKERDELQKDIETMCLQQAGVADSIDIGTRSQARRAASLEQELDSCKEKIMLLTRENRNLQEELSEAYRLKSHLTEAFKRAVEKNNQLEKEVKFYQSKVAVAFSERDKALVEVERVHEAEKVMNAKFQQLHNRVEEAERQSKELDTQNVQLQHDLDTTKKELDTLYKVVDRFWGLRENVLTIPDDGQPQQMQPLDRATALLLDSDDQWAYGGCNREAKLALQEELKEARALAENNGLLAKEKESEVIELGAQLAQLKEEVRASTHSLQIQLEEKQHAQQLAAEKAFSYEIQLAKLQKFAISKVMEVQTNHEDARTTFHSLLEDEKQWINSMVVNFEALLSELKASEVHLEIVDKYEENRSPPQEEIPLPAADASIPVTLEDNPLPAAAPPGTVDLEENLLPAAQLSRTVDLEENPLPAAAPPGTVDLEENPLPAAAPPGTVDLEENPLPAAAPPGTVDLEENPLPAAAPPGTVDLEENLSPAVESSGPVDLEENLSRAAEPSGAVDLEENLVAGAEPSGVVDLEESIYPSAEPSRAVDFEEPHTSEDTMELERTALSLQDQNVPELFNAEHSPRPDVSVSVSSVQPESIAGARPVTDNDNRINEEPCSAVVTLSRSATDMDEDDRKALAQALHEKVEALLLLSQQEERYYLESKTIQGLEFQIKDLNEKISQVTREKVSALMEVAQLRHDCQRLEEREKELIRKLQLHRSTNAGGRLLPASWSDFNVGPEKSQSVTEKQIIVPKPITTSGYLKSWLRGLDMSGPGVLKAASEPTKQSVGTNASKSTVTEGPVDLAKLRVENAALQERVAAVQRLTESAHRLRMTLLKVSTDSEIQKSVESLHSALEIVDGVRRESSHLRIALGCSLPVSVTPESTFPPLEESNPSTREDVSSSSGGEVHTAVDVATAAGIEMVELLLAACGMQKGGLQRQIDFLALQCKDSGGE